MRDVLHAAIGGDRAQEVERGRARTEGVHGDARDRRGRRPRGLRRTNSRAQALARRRLPRRPAPCRRWSSAAGLPPARTDRLGLQPAVARHRLGHGLARGRGSSAAAGRRNPRPHPRYSFVEGHLRRDLWPAGASARHRPGRVAAAGASRGGGVMKPSSSSPKSAIFECMRVGALAAQQPRQR